jgi:hypothetical protein
MNKCFSKDEIQTAKKFIKKYSTSLTVMKMHIKTSPQVERILSKGDR